MRFVTEVAQLVCAIAALYGKILVISCYVRFSKLRTGTNQCIMILAVVFLWSTIYIALQSILGILHSYDSEISEMPCKDDMTTMQRNHCGKGFFLAILSVDRYFAIVRKTSRTLRYVAGGVILAGWIAIVTLSYIYSRTNNWACHNSWPDIEDYTDCEVAAVYIFVLSFVLPLILIVIFNILVNRWLKNFKSSQIVVVFNRSAAGAESLVDQSNRLIQIDREINNATREVSMSLLQVTAIWALCSIPFAVCYLMLVVHPDQYVTNSNFVDTVLLANVILVSGTMMIPVLYALLNENYRECVWKLITCAAFGDVNASLRGERGDQGAVVEMTELQQS